jgi:hypothetical protein
MQSLTQPLIKRLKQINNFLAKKVEQEPNYQKLIDELEELLNKIKTQRIKVLIVSSNPQLANKLQQVSKQIDKVRSLYQFEIIIDLKNCSLELQNYHLLCFLHDAQTAISPEEQKILEQVSKTNICLAVFSINNINNAADNSSFNFSGNFTSLEAHLSKRNYNLVHHFFIAFEHLNSPVKTENIICYQQFLEELAISKFISFNKNFEKKINQNIKKFFSHSRGCLWQTIQNHQENYSQPDLRSVQQKNKEIFQKINKYQHYIFKIIKNNINQAKSELLNPFDSTSLIYKVQQCIQKAEVGQLTKEKEKFLYLFVKEIDYPERLHTYVLNLCEIELSKWLEAQWELVENLYSDGGLQGFLSYIDKKLELISPVCKESLKIEPPTKPQVQLNNWISLSVLEENSKTPFDYHFSYSSWFRLSIAAAVGLIIFCLTGKLYGFVFLVFQFINILTGKDIKTIKIEQQTKELKRILDNKYQSLVRLLVENTQQTLIEALEEESQKYQVTLEAIASQTDAQLTQVKTTIRQHKERLNNLKQDEAKITSLLE